VVAVNESGKAVSVFELDPVEVKIDGSLASGETDKMTGGKLSISDSSPLQGGAAKRVKIDSSQSQSPVVMDSPMSSHPFRIPFSHVVVPDATHLPDLWNFKLGFGDRFIFRHKGISYLSRAICYEVSKSGNISLHHHYVSYYFLRSNLLVIIKCKG
jgi:hypothetical protein